jgi:subfamily B ATP-binding cassette protein HlyB/CyaB
MNVAFHYSEHHPRPYRDHNMTLKPRHLAVLMRPSGCGKSTLAKLLLDFYQPTDGQIQLDGRDIRFLAANELHQTFGVVPQETVLFSGTIYDNLVMAHPHAADCPGCRRHRATSAKNGRCGFITGKRR